MRVAVAVHKIHKIAEARVAVVQHPPAPLVVRASASPPAPLVVPASSRPVAVRAQLKRVVTVRLVGATTSAARAIRSWRRIGPGKLVSLDGLGQSEGPRVIVEPTTAQLAIMLDAGNAFLSMACNSCRDFLGWALGAAQHMYSLGVTPAVLWGPDLARSLAHAALTAHGMLTARKMLADGSAFWLIEGDTLTILLPAGGLGWVSNSYITGNPDPRVQPTMLDRLGFSSGGMALSGVIAGTEAAAAEVVAGGVATEAETTARLAADVPVAIRAAGAATSPAAAAAAARGMASISTALMRFAAQTDMIKWVALAIAASKVPDAINALRGGGTRATEAGTNAAGKLMQWGMDHNDPAAVRAGLDAFKGFQETAESGDKYLYAAGGFVAGELLRRR